MTLSHRAIVFDLWQTLAHKGIGVSESLRQLIGLPAYDGYLKDYERAIQLRVWRDFDQLARGYLAAFGRPASSSLVERAAAVFKDALLGAEPFPDMERLVCGLRSHLRVGLLSNTTNLEAAILNTWDVNRCFDARVFSWQTGLLKPKPGSFHAICDALGVSSDATILIDDSQENITAATTLGMTAILHIDPAATQSRLRALGVVH